MADHWRSHFRISSRAIHENFAFFAEDNLVYIFNHVFLPPQLPQSQDKDIQQSDAELMRFVQRSAERYTSYSVDPERWERIKNMLGTMGQLRVHPIETEISAALSRLKSGGIFAMYIEAQNACLIIRHLDREVSFESFECANPNEAIMSCESRLICTYPGPTMAISIQDFKHPNFIETLASYLEQMNVAFSLPRARVTTRKAKTEVNETRDTPNPVYVCQDLMAMLLGMGKLMGEDDGAVTITKRVRDEVNWHKAKLPWRRSPFWLAVRVALHTSLPALPPEEGEVSTMEYKSFMLFLLTEFTALAVERDFRSDDLKIMLCKISRRITKLRNSSLHPGISRHAVETCQRARTVQEERWKKIQQEFTRKFDWRPQELRRSIESAMHLSLKSSWSYIQSRLNAPPLMPYPTSQFLPPERAARLRDSQIDSSDLVRTDLMMNSDLISDQFAGMYDFEQWVQHQLNAWVDQSISRGADVMATGCQELENVINAYSTHVFSVFAKHPERLSVGILIIMELWVALDRLAIAICPMMKDYSPSVPVEMFAPLVLSRLEDMKRLDAVEKYIRARVKAVDVNRFPSLFSSEADENSFAARYYQQSSAHQTTLSQILLAADREHQAKVDELSHLKQKISTLEELRASLTCLCYHTGRGKKKRKITCERCKLLSQINKIHVYIFEWPVPSKSPTNLDNWIFVFELQLPRWFGVWRDITYNLICHRLPSASQLSSKSSHTFYSFDYYSIIKPRAHAMSRVSWGSGSAKPWSVSHYRSLQVTSWTSVNDVCLEHALKYSLYDRSGLHVIDESMFSECDFRSSLTPSISSLGRYVNVVDKTLLILSVST